MKPSRTRDDLCETLALVITAAPRVRAWRSVGNSPAPEIEHNEFARVERKKGRVGSRGAECNFGKS